jgi:Cu(I)/Ag(I) efflux system protein CusF
VKKLLAVILVAAFGAFAWFSLPSLDRPQAPGAPWQTARGSGLVLAVDREKGVVTISHGAMPALNMPPMTMGYPVKDKGQLSALQPNQRVEFQIAYDGKDYLIVEIR